MSLLEITRYGNVTYRLINKGLCYLKVMCNAPENLHRELSWNSDLGSL